MIRTTLFLTLALSAFSCEKEDDLIGQVPEEIVYSTSFEDISELQQDNWTGNYTLTEDSPEDGGDFCLELEPQWLPSAGFASFFIPTPQEGNYRIEFWAKTIDWEGTLTVNKINEGAGTSETALTIPLNTEGWTFYEQSFSVLLSDGESLLLNFSAGGTEVATGKVLADELTIYLE